MKKVIGFLVLGAVLASCGPKRMGCGPRRCEVKTIGHPSDKIIQKAAERA